MFLLDTNIISELVKKKPYEPLIQWLRNESEFHLFLSVMTIGEIEKGITKLEEGDKKTLLQRWLHRDVQDRFQGRILPLDEKVLTIWGRVLGEKEIKGIKIPVVDELIAAICIAHNLVLVTRNSKDFENLEVKVMNPWQERTN